MNHSFPRLIAAGIASVLVFAACGGSSDSSHTRNTVLAAEPCITVKPFDHMSDPQSNDIINFCAGAVSYSLDGGVKKLPVPDNHSVEIREEKLPQEINNVQTLNVISYDGAGIAINDDLVQILHNTGCAEGYECTSGEIGPFGGTVLRVSANDYMEIMPTSGEIFADMPTTYLTREEATAIDPYVHQQSNIDNQFKGSRRWHYPSREEFDEIIRQRATNNLYIDRFTQVAMTPQQGAPWCNIEVDNSCVYANYWIADGTEKCHIEDMPLPITLKDGYQVPVPQDPTVGYPVCNTDVLQTLEVIKEGTCSIASDSAVTAQCTARVVPIRHYQPKQTRIVEVSQYDSDNWQYKCLGSPKVTISPQIAGEEMTIRVSSPCLASASTERPVDVHISLEQINEGTDWTAVKSITAPVDGDVGAEDDQVISVNSPTESVSKTYIPRDMGHQLQVYIAFPPVGRINTSAATFRHVTVQSRRAFECTGAKLTLEDESLTADCGGNSFIVAIGTKPLSGLNDDSVQMLKAKDLSNPNTVEISDKVPGWRMFEAEVGFAEGRPAILTGLLCILQCDNSRETGVKISPIDDKTVRVSTKYIGCTTKQMKIAPVDNLARDTHLITSSLFEDDAKITAIENAETDMSRPSSDIFVYVAGECFDNGDEYKSYSVGVVYVDTNSVPAETDRTTPVTVAQTQVPDFLDANVPVVQLAAADTTITISAKDISSVSVSSNGKISHYKPVNDKISIPIAKDVQELAITTTKKNGEVETYTKAISRPDQLPASQSATVTDSTSSNNNLFLVLFIAIALLLLAGILIRKFRTHSESL